jgi:hypothetical protein
MKNINENEEDTYIIKQLKGLRHTDPKGFEEEFETSDIEEALAELKRRASTSEAGLDYFLRAARDEIEPRDDFYPESFDNAVNDILKRELQSEAVPAIAAAIGKEVVKKGIGKMLGSDDENQESSSKVRVLQDYIDDKYPTLIPAEEWVKSGVDTPAKLDYEMAIANYSDTHKDYWGSRPRNFRDRIEENQWDDDNFIKAAKRLNDKADEYREKLRLQSPEYRAEKERELKQKHTHDPSDGGTSLRDVFSSFSREENEG